MAFAGEQPAGRVQPHPAGAGKIDLCPGMQVGEVLAGTRGARDGGDVRLELDQVARDEARGEPKHTECLNQHPGAVPARAARLRQRLLGCPNSRLQPHDIADPVPHGLVDPHQVVNGALPCWLQRSDHLGQQRPRWVGAAERGKFGLKHWVVAERDSFGIGF